MSSPTATPTSGCPETMLWGRRRFASLIDALYEAAIQFREAAVPIDISGPEESSRAAQAKRCRRLLSRRRLRDRRTHPSAKRRALRCMAAQATNAHCAGQSFKVGERRFPGRDRCDWMGLNMMSTMSRSPDLRNSMGGRPEWLDSQEIARSGARRPIRKGWRIGVTRRRADLNPDIVAAVEAQFFPSVMGADAQSPARFPVDQR